MRDIQYKKMFWMNVVLSTFYVFGCLFYFIGINDNSYRVNVFEIICDLFFVITPVFTVIAFYKSIFVGTSLILNIFTSVIYIGFVGSMLTIKLGSIIDLITMLVVSIPFLVNVKVLYKIRCLKES